MKKIKFLVAALLMGTAAMAQQQATDSVAPPSPTLLYEIGYQNAIKYNDYATATTKLYDIVAFYPQDDSLRMDLALLYYQRQMYPSALLVAMDVTKLNPDYVEAIELLGICYENLGLKDQSLEAYEKLYLKTNDIRFQYKMVFLQYDVKRYKECLTNTEILLQNPEIENYTVAFPISETEQKDFTYKVAATNLLGLVHKELGNIDKAREAWENVLAMAPDFQFAKTNLEELK